MSRVARFSLLGAVIAVALLAAACGDDATVPTAATTLPPSVSTTSPPATIEAPLFPVDVEHDAGTTTVLAQPGRIAALSATHVEMLYAMGAGDAVIAGDLFSNYPSEADSLPKLDAFNLNVEAVVELAPDLVVISFDPGGAMASFEAVGIPTLLMGTPGSLDAAYGQIAGLGAAMGRSADADALIESMREGIEAVRMDIASFAVGLRFYHETDPFTFYTPNSKSFVGQLYTLLGMENIADEAPDEFGGGFPQLTPEFIVDADPDLIFLAEFDEDLETLRARDAWDTMTAIREERVTILDADIASRWGPRVVDLFRAIADGVLDHTPAE